MKRTRDEYEALRPASEKDLWAFLDELDESRRTLWAIALQTTPDFVRNFARSGGDLADLFAGLHAMASKGATK